VAGMTVELRLKIDVHLCNVYNAVTVPALPRHENFLKMFAVSPVQAEFRLAPQTLYSSRYG